MTPHRFLDRSSSRLALTSTRDVYRAAFLTRSDAARRPRQSKIDDAGICGRLASADDPRLRLLVTENRAYDLLRRLLPDAQAGMIAVFDTAARCRELVSHRLDWSSDETTAMMCRDLGDVPWLPLPPGLSLRPVLRSTTEPPDGVPLEDAVAAALGANPTRAESPDALAAHLRSLPSPVTLFCAVDEDDVVRATSGSSTSGRAANVFLVNTDPDWRGRGIGQAMTATALRAARDTGARLACLDASDAGLSIYRRLGFESAGRTARLFGR